MTLTFCFLALFRPEIYTYILYLSPSSAFPTHLGENERRNEWLSDWYQWCHLMQEDDIYIVMMSTTVELLWSVGINMDLQHTVRVVKQVVHGRGDYSRGQIIHFSTAATVGPVAVFTAYSWRTLEYVPQIESKGLEIWSRWGFKAISIWGLKWWPPQELPKHLGSSLAFLYYRSGFYLF